VNNCIKAIQGTPTGLFKFRVTAQEKITCIIELAQYADKYMDSVILFATRDGASHVQKTAAGAIRTRFNELKDVRAVEERMSELLLKKMDPAFWSDTLPVDEAVALVSIASVNRNGYVRQAALGQMARTPDLRFVPYIIRRTGDWVPHLRTLAMQVLAGYKVAEFRKGFLCAIPDIESLLKVKRVNLQPVYSEVMQWLVCDVEPAHLLAEVQHLGEASRFRIVRYLLAEHSCGQVMLKSFLADRSFLIRLCAVRHLAKLSEEWTIKLFESALHDYFPNIRRIALKELIRRDRADSPMLSFSLTDPSFDVRDMAAKRLGLSRDALVVHFREHLKAGKRMVGSLLGLRDANGKEHVADILPFTAHTDPLVRQAALLALADLAPDKANDAALLMVVDTNKRIRTKAAALLIKRHDRAVVEHAQALMASEQVMHRLTGLSLLNKFGGWDPLPNTIRACLDDSPRVAEQAWINLNAWVVYARGLFTEAPSQDVEKARSALAHVRSELSQPTYAQQRSLDAVQVFID